MAPRTSRRPSPARSRPLPPDQQWQEHEHVDPRAQAAAEQLLATAGTPDSAKHAIDVAEQHDSAPPLAHHTFAAEAGFTSYVELLAASQTVTGGETAQWRVTPLPQGTWLGWNEQDLRAERFNSREAAENWVREQASSSPSPEA